MKAYEGIWRHEIGVKIGVKTIFFVLESNSLKPI